MSRKQKILVAGVVGCLLLGLLIGFLHSLQMGLIVAGFALICALATAALVLPLIENPAEKDEE